ncbi:uncharacterized protein IL334_005520 [Kwoniella shivajii]|uniref:Alpha/beta hydrolase fold-3 domain-containing protein n=1 Tax=Kwoniella shivajii TaxID=564305 RepID=A0ABZ1D3E0_9TREE|nr:hypothetical protein IL334_005520 [Kwoniella shivajii]
MTTPARHVPPCPKPFTDHIVTTIEGVDIPIRVFPGNDNVKGKKPWLFWIHGGGWVGGKHYIPNVWVHPSFHPLGIHIISVSYRLIPQVKLPDQFSDIQKTFEWCLTNLPLVLGEDQVDIDKYIVGGDSAGGHFSTLCGIKFNPRPSVVLDLYGVIDLSDKHYSTPTSSSSSPTNIDEDGNGEIKLPFNTPLAEIIEFSKELNPKNAVVTSAWTWELLPLMSKEQLELFWGTKYNPSENDKIRMDLNQYYTQNGTRIRALFGVDQVDDYSQEEYERLLIQWSPIHLIKDNYPPTVIMHGDNDVVVPIQESIDFADKLKGLGVDVESIWCEGGGHCFEQSMGSPQDPGWNEYIVPCIEFVKKHLSLSE